MIFFRNAIASVYNPEFYRNLLTAPLRRSFHYYLVMVLVFSLSAALIFGLWQIPRLQDGGVEGWVSSLLSPGEGFLGWTDSDLGRMAREIEVAVQESPLSLVIAFFLSLFLVGFINLISLLFLAILVRLLTRLRGVELEYAKSFQISLHAATLPLGVKYLVLVFWPGANLFLLPSALLLLVVFLNFKPPRDLVLEAEA